MVADKYIAGSAEKMAEAGAALRRAMELNPDLLLAHNFYTHVRAWNQDGDLVAMRRLRKVSKPRAMIQNFSPV
jgi:hypothetical protein